MYGKKVKLNFLTRNSLAKKGKKDAKNGIIEINYDIPVSPYFEEETSLCIANLHKEYEKFLRYKTKILKRIVRYEKKTNKYNARIKMINDESDYNSSILEDLDNIVFEKIDFDDVAVRRLMGESVVYNNEQLLSDDVLREYRTMEKRAIVEAEKYDVDLKKDALIKKISKQPKQIFKVDKKVARSEALSKRELKKLYCKYEVFISKCNQYYEITSARISAYWNGVKYNFSENTNFDTEKILSKIKDKICQYEQIGDNDKC